ncbi:MAG: ribonuclease HI [Thermodesulfobacteriota bacterium]|nr:ribonuclease HI [Thermodesulfobacteriota bacterium]
MAKKKFYAVVSGLKPGIYTSWPEAEAQVKGYGGAKFKGFASRAEAEAWMDNPPEWQQKKKPVKKKTTPYESPVVSGDRIEIYTDGGAINNPGPGGYGVVILAEDTIRELTGGYLHTTNNRMELMACIQGIEALPSRKRKVALFSDSKYVVNGISKGWAREWRKRGWLKSDGKPAVNPDLWEMLLDLTQGLDISFHWVKGHAGHPLNERCDQLAVQSARGDGLVEDFGYKG